MLWETPLGSSRPSSPIVLRDGRLFVATSTGVTALAADGPKLWAARLGFVAATPALSPTRELIVGTNAGGLITLDPATEGTARLRTLVGGANRNTLIYFQVREENKSRNVSDEKAALYLTDTGIKRNYLFSVQIEASKSLKLRSRIQGSSFNFNKTKTSGFAIIQDVIWTQGRFSLTGRYALFDTDDYDNRQYVYENDVWLAFSIPAYSGKGVRNYVLAQYKFNKHLSVWARYSHVRYTDRETIGSGYDVTEGNQQNDIKLQIKIVL
jgi:hypothetical protein